MQIESLHVIGRWYRSNCQDTFWMFMECLFITQGGVIRVILCTFVLIWGCIEWLPYRKQIITSIKKKV